MPAAALLVLLRAAPAWGAEAPAQPAPELPRLIASLDSVGAEAKAAVSEIEDICDGLSGLREHYQRTGQLDAVRGQRESLRERFRAAHAELTRLLDEYRELKTKYYAQQMMQVAAGVQTPLNTPDGMQELGGALGYEQFDRKIAHARQWAGDAYSFEESVYAGLIAERAQRRRLGALAAAAAAAILGGGAYLWRRRRTA